MNNLIKYLKTKTYPINMEESTFSELPQQICDRVPNTFYRHENTTRFWNGKRLQCEHKKKEIDALLVIQKDGNKKYKNLKNITKRIKNKL